MRKGFSRRKLRYFYYTAMTTPICKDCSIDQVGIIKGALSTFGKGPDVASILKDFNGKAVHILYSQEISKQQHMELLRNIADEKEEGGAMMPEQEADQC